MLDGVVREVAEGNVDQPGDFIGVGAAGSDGVVEIEGGQEDEDYA